LYNKISLFYRIKAFTLSIVKIASILFSARIKLIIKQKD
jgi:hypothetical protein